MKTTSTLYSYIITELQNQGKSELVDNHQLTFYDDEYAFIKKMFRLDDDVLQILNDKIFIGFSLENKEHDKQFKRLFLNTFYAREWNRQTVEDFASRVLFVCLSHEQYLNTIYTSANDYMKGKSTSNNNSKGNTLSDNRSTHTTLSDNEVNVDVDKTTLDYADEFSLNRNRNKSDNTTDSESYNYSIDALLKSKNIFMEMMNTFERNCFINVG